MDSNLYGTTIGILILSIIYSVFLNIIFKKKDKINTKSTNSFQKLIIINLVGLILELARILLCLKFGVQSIVSVIIYRLFILNNGIFSLFFLYYIYSLSVSDDIYNKNKKIATLVGKLSILAMCLLSFVMPFEIHIKNGIYSTGLLSSSFYIFSMVCVLISGILIVDSLFKKVSSFKNYYGFIVLVFGEGLIFYLQSLNEFLSLISVMECIAILTMYFTIENTDKKIIEKLEKAKNEAEKASQEKSDFLSSMSHEIRTPLNAIVGFSQTIRDKENLPDKIKNDANNIIDASNTLLEIIENVLDINKIESSELEIISKPYECAREIETLARINSFRIGDKPIKFNLFMDPNIPNFLVGDIAHIKEIVTNVLSNAMKYTKKGEIDLKVLIEFKDNNKCNLVITCEDTGIGMSKEKIKEIFDRIDNIDDNIVQGKGLGLSITKNLVELMNGEIKIESELGKGTKFIIKIPQKIGESDNLVEKVITTNDSSKKVSEDINSKNESKKGDVQTEQFFNNEFNINNIMIVDDNKMNIKVAERTLNTMGVNTKGYLSGQECIDAINNGEKYDIILMDIMMPEMSGTDTLNKLNELDGFNVPVIAFTADVVEGSEEKYLNQGFCYYLPKPFNKEQLNDALRKILEKNN